LGKMNDADDLDPRLAARVHGFADETLATFDAERVAAAAMTPKRRPMWQLAAVSVAAVLVIASAVAIAGSLSGGGPLGASPLATPSDDPATTSSPGESSPTPMETATPTSTGRTEEQAVAAARGAAPQSADREVRRVETGPSGELLEREVYEFSSEIPSDRWVWVIILASQGQGGSSVVIDFLDGRVYGVVNFVE
jgi:hypothetical protein